MTLGQFVLAATGLTLSLASGPARADGVTDRLAPLLGTTYRDDGVDDPRGRHTLFANQAATFPTSGFNCSGFVTTASRVLLGRPLPLDDVRRDRKGDSGPQSPRGEDWDFGYDLIVNITDGLPRRILLPTPTAPPDPARIDAAGFRGFPLHDEAAWKGVLAALKPGEMALGALSKTKGGRLYYYHVGLLVRVSPTTVFWYHATPGTGVHRLEMTTPAGLAAFRKEFTEKRFGEKWILLVAVPLPTR